MNEQDEYALAPLATPAQERANADNVKVAAPDRNTMKSRLRQRLADCEAEANSAKTLIDNFKAQWRWLGVDDGQPVELQQLAPKAPDEDLGDALRARNRHDASTGEYRPMNRYARVHGLRQALVLLAHASDNFQVQGLYILGNRLKRAVADKARVDVWLSFSKDSGTTDGDIAARAVLMLDVDPRREDGVKDISATDEERRHAIERALNLYADLVEILGSDRSLALVSSGNGAQVHVRVDLPNTAEVTQTVKRLLLVLDQLYSTDTEELDTAVFDPKRLFPACGTWKRKGASNPASGRVHRPSLFLPAAESPDVLSAGAVARLLETLEGRLAGEQRAAVDADMRIPGARPAAGARQASSKPGAGESAFSTANAVSVGDVARKLGLDPESLACPACGATSNVDSLESKGINVIKCPHATCGARSWRPVDLVAKLRFGCDDLKGSKSAASDVLGWFADNFGLEVGRSKKTAGKPTATERAENDARYSTVLAELRARATARDGGVHGGARATTSPATPDQGVAADGEVPPPASAAAAGPSGPAATEPDPSGSRVSPPPPLSDAEIDDRLRAVVGRSALEQETGVNALHADTGKTKGALRARLKELETEQAPDEEPETDKMVGLGELLDRISFVRSTAARVFAVLDNGDVIPATSPALKARIAYLFREATGGYAGPSTIETALLPRLGGDLVQQVVPIRYAYGADGSIWVDLAGKPSRYAHVTKSHVTVEASCPIAFYRPATMGAMPAPVIPKDDAECKTVINAAEKHFQITREQIATAFVWTIGATRPGEPHGGGKLTEYLLMFITGAQGSGKTSFADALGATIDPCQPQHVKLSPDDEALAILAENRRAVVFNNVSYIAPWMSDSLCELADGSGMLLRARYTDRDANAFMGSNPVAITGIPEVVTAADLLDRTLSIALAERSIYLEPEELEAQFMAFRPRLLGAFLYCASRALRNLGKVRAPKGVRMAGAARWAVAASTAAGFTVAEMEAVFEAAMKDADGQVLEGPVAGALMEVVAVGASWSGTTKDLLAALTVAYEARVPYTESATKKLPKGWPATPQALRSVLRRLSKTLTRAGFVFAWPTTGGRGGRVLTITRGAVEGSDATETADGPAGPMGMGLDDPADWDAVLAADFAEANSARRDEQPGDPSPPATTEVSLAPPRTMAERSGTMPHPGTSHRSLDETRGGNDGNDGNDVFPLLEEEKKEKVGWKGEDDRMCSLSPSYVEGRPIIVPIVPIVPASEKQAGTMDTSGGLGSVPHRSAPSPRADDRYGVLSHPLRARAIGARVERSFWSQPDDEYPRGHQLVVEVETELGRAVFVRDVNVVFPDQTIALLSQFGGDQQVDGSYVLQPVDLSVQVCRRVIFGIGDVFEVVAVSLAAQPRLDETLAPAHASAPSLEGAAA